MSTENQEQKRDTRWKPGESGNPAGRPPGAARKLKELREKIVEHVPAILEQLASKAKEGDAAAARLLLERALPPIKAMEEATPLDLPSGTLTERAEAILQAVAAGDLAPGQGAQLLTALGNVAKAREIDELSRRIEALEQRNGAAK